jgi:hypothetical protein
MAKTGRLHDFHLKWSTIQVKIDYKIHNVINYLLIQSENGTLTFMMLLCKLTRKFAVYRSCFPKKVIFRRVFVTSGSDKRTTPFQLSLGAASVLATVSLSVGFVVGSYASSSSNHHQHDAVLPNGLPRTCCDDASKQPSLILTQEQFDLPRKLKRIVGSDNVLDGSTLDTTTSGFLKGARLGEGSALCIVTPRHLHDVEAALEAIVDADCVVIPQGQNTGLTGGSVPHMKKDTRPIVIMSMKYLDSIFPIDDGERVVCFAGVGLASVSSKAKNVTRVFTTFLIEIHYLMQSWISFCRNIFRIVNRTRVLVLPF